MAKLNVRIEVQCFLFILGNNFFLNTMCHAIHKIYKLPIAFYF